MINIGIGIPVRNGEKYLQQAIQSAIAQVEPADEILILVNNSSDCSLAIAQTFQPQVRIVEDNLVDSIGAAWNSMYRHSTCDYVVMLHQDDLLYPQTIQSIKGAIAGNPELGVIFGRMNILSATGKIEGVNYSSQEVNLSGNNYLEKVMQGFLPGCSGMCAHRQTILDNPFRTDLNIFLDVEFFIRMAWKSKIQGITEILSGYRIHTESTLQIDHQARQAMQSREDLLLWWQLVCDRKINVPLEIEHKYKITVFKRIIRAFLNDLLRCDRSQIQTWIDFLDLNLAQNPIYQAAFTPESLTIYSIVKTGGFGYYLASIAMQMWIKFQQFQKWYKFKIATLFSQQQ